MTDDRDDVLAFARAEMKYPRSNVWSQLCTLVLRSRGRAATASQAARVQLGGRLFAVGCD